MTTAVPRPPFAPVKRTAPSTDFIPCFAGMARLLWQKKRRRNVLEEAKGPSCENSWILLERVAFGALHFGSPSVIHVVESSFATPAAFRGMEAL